MECVGPSTVFSAAISLSTTWVTTTVGKPPVQSEPIRARRDGWQVGEEVANGYYQLVPRQRTRTRTRDPEAIADEEEESETDFRPSTSRRSTTARGNSATPSPSRTRFSGTATETGTASSSSGTESELEESQTSASITGIISRTTAFTSTPTGRVTVIPIVHTLTIQVPVQTIPGTCTSVPPIATATGAFSNVLITTTVTHSDSRLETITTLVPTQLNTTGERASSKQNPGKIAGIVIGLIAAILIMVLAALFCLRRRRGGSLRGSLQGSLRPRSNSAPRRLLSHDDQEAYQFPMEYHGLPSPSHPYAFDYGAVNRSPSPASSSSRSSPIHPYANLSTPQVTDADVAALRALRSSGSQSGSIFREDFGSGREGFPDDGNRRSSFLSDTSRAGHRPGGLSLDQQLIPTGESAARNEFGQGQRYHHDRYGTGSTSAAILLSGEPSPTLDKTEAFGRSSTSLGRARLSEPPSSYYFVDPTVKERRSWSAPSTSHPAMVLRPSSSSSSLPFVLRTARGWSDGDNGSAAPVAVRDLIASEDPFDVPAVPSTSKRDSYVLPELPPDISGSGSFGRMPKRLISVDDDVSISQTCESPISDEPPPL